MLFNSYEYIFAFLPISFFLYFFLLDKHLVTAAKGFLVFASLFFYSWWNLAYLPIILGSMLFNYILGSSLNQNNIKVKISKKTLLGVGIVANILLLAYFKYSDFFIQNINMMFGAKIGLFHITLPLAISFFTFQQIAYLIDSYRKETKEYDFLNYALFVTFFPQLIAGPIVHHKEMMPQFASKWNLIKNYKNIALGIFIFSIGLFKKVVIADTFAQWSNHGFDVAKSLNLYEAWATSLSYTFQLYFDFSGYTDMAIGAALLFNIKIPINFNSPYKATSIQDFWRRWHITLSRFLRDYIYIPLGGNRKGKFKTYNNLMVTFLIGGIWHGAGWMFVIWGLLHGIALVIQKIWNEMGFKMHMFLAWFITFNFLNITWVFFRAKEWNDALKVLKGMFGQTGISITEQSNKFLGNISSWNKFYSISDNAYISSAYEVLVFILSAFIITLMLKNSTEYINGKKYRFYQAVFVAATILIFHFSTLDSTESVFLYFNF